MLKRALPARRESARVTPLAPGGFVITAPWLAATFAAALAVRLAWAWYSPARPAPPRFDDSVFYYEMARNLASGAGYTHPWSGLATAQWPPGYPFFLAGLFRVIGPSVTAAQVANAMLGALTAVLAAVLAWLLVRRQFVALLAGLITAISPGSVLMAGLVMSETLFTFLLLLGLVVIIVVPRLTGRRQSLAVCTLAVVTGLAALTREAGLALIPTAMAFWLLTPETRRAALRWSALLVAGVALTILPWTLRNYRTMHTLIPISSSDAGNFWQSHHQSVNGRPAVDLVARFGPLTRPGGEVAVNHAEWRDALRYALAHPGRDLASALHNVRVLYQGDRGGLDWNDMHGLLSFMSPAQRAALGDVCDASYYLLLALAVSGLLLAGARSAAIRLLVPLVVVWTAGTAPFIAEARYHLPLVPAFAVAAGLGASALFESAQKLAAVCASLALPRRGRVVLACAATPAVIGALLLSISAARSSTARDAGAATAATRAAPVIDARMICSFSNADATTAMVQGADGGASVAVGGRTYWLFGDTLLLPQSGKQIEQNSLAWSTGLHPGGCPALQYYAPNGVAAPFLAKDGSLTVWPAGAWPEDDRSFDFFTTYVYGSGPVAYWIGEVGVARFDTETMQTTVLSRALWDQSSGFIDHVIGASPVNLDNAGRLRVILHTQNAGELLARVMPAQIAAASAYEFWDGRGWSRSAAAARPLWQHTLPSDPMQRLATYENGANITYDAGLHEYIALQNVGIDWIGARTASRIEGPWSAPTRWLDCAAIARPAAPFCYGPSRHPEVSSTDGHELSVTFTRFASYDTVAYDVTIGSAIHRYTDAHGVVAYGTSMPSAGTGWSDRGIAFYASEAPRAGFVPVFRWSRGLDVRYATSSPAPDFERGSVAFYAPVSDVNADATVRYRPVFDWIRGVSHLLAPADDAPKGYERGAVAFFAP